MNYVAFAWIASVSYGLLGVVGKLAAKHQIKNPWLFTFIWHLFLVIFTIPVALHNGVGVPEQWSVIIFAALFNALFHFGYILSLQKLDISAMMPLFNFRIVFVMILAGLFLGEVYTQWEYLLIFIIILAGIFVTIDEKFDPRSFFQSRVAIMILSVFMISLFSLFINQSIANNGLWTTTMWVILLTQAFLTLSVPAFHKEIKTVKQNQLISGAAMALFAVVGEVTQNKALGENLVITSIIVSLPISMIIAFLASVVAPHLLEKHILKVYAVRFAAATIMIIATLKLTL